MKERVEREEGGRKGERESGERRESEKDEGGIMWA